jgi:hypothetical protein
MDLESTTQEEIPDPACASKSDLSLMPDEFPDDGTLDELLRLAGVSTQHSVARRWLESALAAASRSARNRIALPLRISCDAARVIIGGPRGQPWAERLPNPADRGLRVRHRAFLVPRDAVQNHYVKVKEAFLAGIPAQC